MISESDKGRLWYERDYPVLQAVAKRCEESDFNHATSWEVAEDMGLPVSEVVTALGDLGTKYLILQDVSSAASRDYMVNGLTAEGLVAAHIWPNTDDLAERLITALEKMLDETPEGSPKSKRLTELLDNLRQVGVGGAGGLLGQALGAVIGLGG